MSMPIIKPSDEPIERPQAINDLIESIALIETGLSHIINAEGEKIQKVVNCGENIPIENIIDINDSVRKMISSISQLEMVLQSKLEIASELDE